MSYVQTKKVSLDTFCSQIEEKIVHECSENDSSNKASKESEVDKNHKILQPEFIIRKKKVVKPIVVMQFDNTQNLIQNPKEIELKEGKILPFIPVLLHN